MDKPVSPPPSKRRRVLQSSEAPIFDPGRRSFVIFSWNVNGIAPFLQPSITSFFGSNRNKSAEQDNRSSALSLRKVLKRFGWPSMLLLQEVKINPDDQSTQKAVERAVSSGSDEEPGAPSYRAFFCLPKDRYNARGFGRKVYGVCTIVRDDFCTEFGVVAREVDWDQEGRFLVLETQARKGVPRLAVINCYMVNGTNAPYKDSSTGELSGTRHDRKLRVHELLQTECRSLEADGVEVVVAGDMNVARSKLDGHPNLRTFPEQHCINRADFERRFFSGEVAAGSSESKDKFQPSESLDMVDSFREVHPRRAGYTYYPRTKQFGSSADRVDMIILSHSLKANLTRADMLETAADRGPSDHVPLFAELSFAEQPERAPNASISKQ